MIPPFVTLHTDINAILIILPDKLPLENLQRMYNGLIIFPKHLYFLFLSLNHLECDMVQLFQLHPIFLRFYRLILQFLDLFLQNINKCLLLEDCFSKHALWDRLLILWGDWACWFGKVFLNCRHVPILLY